MNVRDLNKKIVIEISLLLLDTEFEFKNPYVYFDENFSLLQQYSSWASADVDNLDVEFISEFIEMNLSFLNKLTKKQILINDILSKIKIPVLKNYTIFYEVWGNCILTEEYKTDWKSYCKEYASLSIKESWNQGSFNHVDGKYLNLTYDNFESDNFEVSRVEELNETKKTFLSKVIVENTIDVVDHLDMDTLMNLRDIINQKLSSFL